MSAAAAPLLLSSCIAVPLFPFSLSLSVAAAAKEGGMTSFARSITFVLGGCRSALSLSLLSSCCR